MSTNVLLSIKPSFADAILGGAKLFEFRRKLFRREGVDRVIIYASMPVGRVVGEFEVSYILSLAPARLWDATGRGAGISKAYFDRYFRGVTLGHAIAVGAVTRYDVPVNLMDAFGLIRPPQSFQYV